jgi:metal-sulfur cluster biosynthetic enzyme
MERNVVDGLTSERHREVLAAINGIVDPCSAAIRVPIGIADLGLVEALELDGGRVEVVLITTSPFCMFVGLFQEEVERRVSAMPWVESVHVRLNGEPIWEESRMTSAARAELAERYPRPRPQIIQLARPNELVH